MPLFNTQSLFTIIMETGRDDLATATVTRILYKKPGGTTGYWEASVQGENLIYSVENGDIDIVGQWTFQAYFEIGGKRGYGTIVTQQIQKPIL